MAAAGSSEAAGSLAVQADDSSFERVSLPRAAARAFSQFRAHDMTDHAAALTYYSMMALFPMLLVAISLLGLFGQAEVRPGDEVRGPGRRPVLVEVEAERALGVVLAALGEPHGPYARPVRERDDRHCAD